jgi:hypothetical protein
MRTLRYLGASLICLALLSSVSALSLLGVGKAHADEEHAVAAPSRNVGDRQKNRLPANTILVKGAWSSASDSTTPVPEGGKVSTATYDNPYFGFTLPLSAGWIQKYEGPPPSDSGYYVLAQLRPSEAERGPIHGTLLVAAQDLFFSPIRFGDSLELINYSRAHLRADYRVEYAPTNVTIAGRSFVRFAYMSPTAGLHWIVLATQIRCHVVEFIFTSGDPHFIEQLARSVNELGPSAQQSNTGGSDNFPVCVKDYANGQNVLERVNPYFTEQKYNSIPVRVTIDREGKVKHIHFLSAFPSQAQAITTALSQWRFKPYLRNGQPVEVETGILFGHAQRGAL